MVLLTTKVKNAFKRFHPELACVDLKNTSVNGAKRGCSGFVTDGNGWVYLNANVSSFDGKDEVALYRGCDGPSDFRGKTNLYCKRAPDVLAEAVAKELRRMAARCNRVSSQS